jgi:valyl-tRNA synthetase
MLHPFMPFITEHIWQRLDQKTPIMASSLPHVQKEIIDSGAENAMERIIEIIVAIRNIRAEMNIDQRQKLNAIISFEKACDLDIEKELTTYASRLAGVEKASFSQKAKRPKFSASSILDFCQVYIPLEGIVDTELEKRRLNTQLKDSESLLAIQEKKLSNKNFIEKAPKDIVEQELKKTTALKDKIKRIKENISNLS